MEAAVRIAGDDTLGGKAGNIGIIPVVMVHVAEIFGADIILILQKLIENNGGFSPGQRSGGAESPIGVARDIGEVIVRNEAYILVDGVRLIFVGVLSLLGAAEAG